MKYVALVRGINVGGNHRVPKAEFQTVLEEFGFQDVVIYLNSGNAVFASDHEPKAADVQAALEKHFGFTIPTLILSAEKIKTIAATIPEDWTNDAPKPDKSGQKSDVLYLFDEANTADVLEKIRYRPEVETMIYTDGAIVANVSRKNQSKYSLLKVVGTPLYRQMTVRNITTAKKLAQLVEDE
ncbi:MAG TPA: DUF1697 domain-containing protein [Candidatus Saccharimonadales bacterium]